MLRTPLWVCWDLQGEDRGHGEHCDVVAHELDAHVHADQSVEQSADEADGDRHAQGQQSAFIEADDADEGCESGDDRGGDGEERELPGREQIVEFVRRAGLGYPRWKS